ncbi:hypothetical protein MMC21_006604 [Puttea exsequens]|nr:hypothetical protein [Puttea exsequens]
MLPLDEPSAFTISGLTLNEEADDFDPGALRNEFYKAIYAHDIDRLKEFLRVLPSLQLLTAKDLDFALTSAVTAGDLPIIKLMLRHGAPITISSNVMASRRDIPNTLEILQTFLQHGWSVESTATRDGRMTMNMMMARDDSKKIIRWFLDNGAPVNGIGSDPIAPIRAAAGGARDLEVARLLLSRGATLNHTSSLHGATFRNGPDDDELAIGMMNLLLDAGVDVNELEYEGKRDIPQYAYGKDSGTALHTAAREGYLARAKLLVKRGANVAKKSWKGYTAKDWAQINEQEDVRSYLEAVMKERGIDAEDIEVPEQYLGERSSRIRVP